MKEKTKMKLPLMVLVLIILLVGTFQIISAEEIRTTEVQSFNFVSWFQHTFGIQTYSVVGDARQCSLTADKTIRLEGNEVLQQSASTYCSSGHGLWDVFSPKWNPWKEYNDNIDIRCNPNNDYCMVELYCCDHPEPTSNSNCREWYDNSDYEKERASCSAWYNFDDNPDLDGYKCTTIYGTERDIPYKESSFNYCILGEGGDEQIDCYYYPGSGDSCLKKTYPGTNCPSSFGGNILYKYKSTCEANIEEPSTCSDGIQNQGETGIDCGGPCDACANGDCTSFGESDCLSHNECEWVDANSWIINKHCIAKTPINLDAVIYNIEAPVSVEAGKEVVVEFDVKNKGDTGNYLIEAGIIPKETADAWGFTYSIFNWLTQKNTECCEGQPNIFAKTTKLTSGEIDSFKLKIPQAPYSGIEDLCYDNVYWDGEGEYVLYVIVKTDCYPEGENVAWETRAITINGNGNEESSIKAKTLTWSEYYSIEDKEILKSVCTSDSECPSKIDYNVSCDKSESMQERIYNANLEICKDEIGGGLIRLLPNVVSRILTGKDSCEHYVNLDNWIKGLFSPKEEPGICIAESTTRYGQAWDKALQTVGGLGLPAQSVLIITVIILITLLGVIIKFVAQK